MVIEMHGYVWHDINKTRPSLIELVKTNIINDMFKKEEIIKLGFNYSVFWDDEINKWDEQIKQLFNIMETKHENINNQINGANNN
jgi:hypothetical protein